MARYLLFMGAVLGFLAVALGAFGAHILRSSLSEPQMEIFKTATHYQMIHALAILISAVVCAIRPNGWFERAGRLWLVGTLVFSGSLYLLVGTGVSKLGAITPFGGALLLSGWACFAWAAVRPESSR